MIILAKTLLRQIQKKYVPSWQKPWKLPTAEINLTSCVIVLKKPISLVCQGSTNLMFACTEKCIHICAHKVICGC